MSYLRSHGGTGMKSGVLPALRGLPGTSTLMSVPGEQAALSYSAGPVTMMEAPSASLCLHFPGLWWPFSLPPLLSRLAAGGGEGWPPPTELAKHAVLRHLNGSTGE